MLTFYLEHQKSYGRRNCLGESFAFTLTLMARFCAVNKRLENRINNFVRWRTITSALYFGGALPFSASPTAMRPERKIHTSCGFTILTKGALGTEV